MSRKDAKSGRKGTVVPLALRGSRPGKAKKRLSPVEETTGTPPSSKRCICVNPECRLRRAGCRGFIGCPGFKGA
jgi:hypothetical protein